MKKQDIVMLNAQELKRLHVLGMFFDKKITQLQASELLGLSTRQIRRIAKNIKSNGQKDIAHKLRTKPSNRKKPDQLKKDVISLYKNKYADFGPTFAAEKMASLDHIKIAKETLRLWLIEAGIHKKRRRPRPHRSYRDRKPCFGQMVQADGSTHAWFENRGPKACFMAYIDDAVKHHVWTVLYA
jgi:hypothetical protein